MGSSFVNNHNTDLNENILSTFRLASQHPFPILSGDWLIGIGLDFKTIFTINTPKTLLEAQIFFICIIIICVLLLKFYVDITGHFLKVLIYSTPHGGDAKLEKDFGNFKFILNYFKKSKTSYLIFKILFILIVYIWVIGVCINILYF